MLYTSRRGTPLDRSITEHLSKFAELGCPDNNATKTQSFRPGTNHKQSHGARACLIKHAFTTHRMIGFANHSFWLSNHLSVLHAMRAGEMQEAVCRNSSSARTIHISVYLHLLGSTCTGTQLSADHTLVCIKRCVTALIAMFQVHAGWSQCYHKHLLLFLKTSNCCFLF